MSGLLFDRLLQEIGIVSRLRPTVSEGRSVLKVTISAFLLTGGMIGLVQQFGKFTRINVVTKRNYPSMSMSISPSIQPGINFSSIYPAITFGLNF